MTSTSEMRRTYSGIALFSFGFRPFFLGASLVAALVPLVTAASLNGLIVIGADYGPILFHGHEMVFGYLGAVVSGFVLTAVPNWTGRLPVLGARLMALFSLWVAGRLVMPMSGLAGPGTAALIDAPFLLFMTLVVWREVVSGNNWRNVPICILITAFAGANLTWHVGLLAGGTGALGWRVGLAVIAVMLALIGGRITPSFTRNWLARTGRPAPDISAGVLDRIAVMAVVTAMAAWATAPDSAISGVLLLVASALHVMRLMRWQGWRTGAEPLVTILHVGYLWLPVSLLLLGIAAIDPILLTPSIAVHALTSGAAGVMPLAVMTRATLGHTGRELRADTATVLIYGLVNLGAVMRLAAGLVPAHYTAVISMAAVAWSGAFIIFAAVYGRYLLNRRPSLPSGAA